MKAFDPQDHQDGQVVAYSQWWPIESYKRHLESRAGVFLFSNKSGQVKYVGRAGGGGMIKSVKSAISSDKDWDATRVKALYTNSDERARDLKKRLKIKYRPLNNV